MSTERFEFITSAATGYQLELLIRQYGIPVSGRWARGNRSGFDVPGKQAKWATYIFQRAGIVPVSVEADGTPRYEQKPLPTTWGVGVRRPSLMTRWVDALGGILGAPRRSQWQAKTKGRNR